MELFKTECWLIRKKGRAEYFKGTGYLGMEDPHWTDIESATRYETRDEAEHAVQTMPDALYSGFRLETAHVQISFVTIGPIEAYDVPTPTGGAR